VPIHGESRHLVEHLAFARENGIPDAVMAENGSVIRLHPGPAEIVDEVVSGRLAIDGKRLIPVDGDVLRARRRMGFGGIAVATVVLDRKGRLHEDPQLSVPGLIDGADIDMELKKLAVTAIADAVEDLSSRARENDEEVSGASTRAIRRVFRDETGRRPLADIHVVRL
jgi:ribonuclease J